MRTTWPKDTVEQKQKLDLKGIGKYLKKDGYADLTLNWPNGGNIGLILDQENSEARFRYTITKNDITENINYARKLSFTKCYFGGVRYWLICECGKRVRVLYLNEDAIFHCRHCLDLSYNSRNESKGGWPEIRLLKLLLKQEDKLAKILPIKRIYYKKKFTKRYKQYIQLIHMPSDDPE